jgi:hypothetical protein
MRILNLQNTILVSLFVAGAATSVACGSSDASRPDATAGATAGGASSGAGASATGGTGETTSGGASPAAGSTSVAGTTSGTAGGSAGGGTSAPSVCDGIASRVLTTSAADAFIDDFEKANINPTTMMADATQASPAWYGFNDITPTNSVQILRTAGGAVSTLFSGHYFGMGAKTPVAGGYGVGVEINVGVDKSISQYCVDASAFQGISFWAMSTATTNNKISAGFVVPSQNMVMNGGDCPDTNAAGCNNYPQKNLVLTSTWAQYTVDFSEVTGSKGAKVVAGKIQQILWLAPTTDWDFSLDEVAFYTGTPPAGAVAAPATGTGGTAAQ